MQRYDRFADFYPVYLKMHSQPTNRRLHLTGNAWDVRRVLPRANVFTFADSVTTL